MKSSDSTTENIEELEMLLEAYFVVIDSTLNKLTSLKEYIDDTEDFINIQLVIVLSLIFRCSPFQLKAYIDDTRYHLYLVVCRT
ncbi:magnesium transporter MRS2-1-like [Iris pallida]|uniref:Magnesium transporter MRS2-1-like n=1 Tax=Iris pallida TaxID=29817 RepID=A0AAX6DFC0_IRIPA|nr:magnesium transporter MRS2-1-like [Iris pallida]KAJ6822561.1 magnesium transporter MRS2-1-like [Iris pallida]